MRTLETAPSPQTAPSPGAALPPGAAHVRERLAGRERLRALGRFAGEVLRGLDPRTLQSGRWFLPLLVGFLRHEDALRPRTLPHADEGLPAVTAAIVRRACVEAALLGVGASAATTGSTLYATEAGPPGLLVALPASAVAVGGEVLLRALVHLRMTSDLAAAHGLRFSPDDPEDLASLYALVLRTERHTDEQDPGRALLHRLVHAEADDLAQTVGRTLMRDGVVRNLVPFLSVATAPAGSWRRTRRLGEVALRYVRFRRTLEDAVHEVRARSATAAEVLLEGVWFLFIADGQLKHDEAALLAHLLRESPPPVRARAMARLVEDDTSWRKRLGQVPARARAPLLQALCVVASVDEVVPPAERQLLHRAAQALHQRLEPDTLDTLVAQFSSEGTVHGSPAPA